MQKNVYVYYNICIYFLLISHKTLTKQKAKC